MIETINSYLFDTVITKKDTSKNKYEGGGYQLDVFTTGGKANKRSSPLIRGFFDSEYEAKNMTTELGLGSGGTKLTSTMKWSPDKKVIQLKITKCNTKFQHYIALVAIPFRGSISGIVAGDDFELAKGLIKNVEPFHSNATGRVYNKILYLVLVCRHYGENTNYPLIERIRNSGGKGAINVCTVKSDIVSKDKKTGLATLKPMSYSVDIDLTDAKLKLSAIPGEVQENLDEAKLNELAPRVQFANIVEVCECYVDHIVTVPSNRN